MNLNVVRKSRQKETSASSDEYDDVGRHLRQRRSSDLRMQKKVSRRTNTLRGLGKLTPEDVILVASHVFAKLRDWDSRNVALDHLTLPYKYMGQAAEPFQILDRQVPPPGRPKGHGRARRCGRKIRTEPALSGLPSLPRPVLQCDARNFTRSGSKAGREDRRFVGCPLGGRLS